MSSTERIYGRPRTGFGGNNKAAADFLKDMTADMSHEKRLAQVRWIASMMDDQFRIPGTPLRFGWDSVLGLFPGIGDVLTSAVSLLIVHHAWQSGASPPSGTTSRTWSRGEGRPTGRLCSPPPCGRP